MVPAPVHKRLVSTLAGRQGRSLLWAACTLTCLLLAAFPAKAFTPDQVDRGRELFRLQCARCHGPEGQGIDNVWKGMTAPNLIGSGAFTLEPRPYQKMRHFQFRNVRDVYEFSSAVMPADQPASLSAEDYWDVISFLLNANGIPVDGHPLTEDEAARISLGQLRKHEKTAGSNPMGGNAPAIEGQDSGGPR